MKTLVEIRQAILEQVAACENLVLLDQIERLLREADENEELLRLDDGGIADVLKKLLNGT